MATITGPAPVTRPASWWDRQGDLIMRRPFSEWTFTHMNWLLPTETVPRPAYARELPRSVLPLACDPEFLARTFTTAFVVLHRGAIVHESYPGRFAGPGTRFQLFSLTKSVTSMLAGIALQDGAIGSLDDPVAAYRPDFAGTAYEEVPLSDLLDMSSGVGGLECWDTPDSDIKRFERAVLGGGSAEGVVRTALRTAPCGTRFNYSTFDAQVLGWVLEAATGRSLASYAAEKLWSRIGAEHDAYYWLTRGRPRTALGAGSLNATARDLARLGLLMARDGRAGADQVVPAGWVHRSRGSAAAHLAVGALGPSGYDHYGYANLWWTLGGTHRAFTGLGVHGQYLFVDPAADVVIVKCSAWPTQDDPALDRDTIDGLQEIAAAYR
jgi:CubicO group peptidase (beta-lactamase class C family)